MGKDQELLDAARNGNIPVVEKILSQRAKRSGPLASLRRGPGANVQDSSGYSALHHAALNGHREAVELLLAHEASVNIVDSKGSSPLHLAAWSGNEDVVRLLLCRGPSVPKVNLTTKDNETALHCAAQYGHTVVVALLLEHGCDPNIRNCRGETALDLAAQYGRLETVEKLLRTHPELIRQYADAPPRTVFPLTPLHRASKNGHKAVVLVLLEAGFPVSALTPAGTALHEAALCGKLEVVRSLLEHGVSLNARDQGNLTVLEVLAQFPAHLTHEMSALITRHKLRKETNSGTLPSPAVGEDKENTEPLPPIPSIGSPYENVRLTPRGGRMSESPGACSPSQWNYYEQEDRRMKNLSDNGGLLAKSLDSSGFVSRSMETSCFSAKSMDSSYLSEELSSSSRLSYQNHGVRDVDQLSVSSSSSMTGPSISPRERFVPPPDMDRHSHDSNYLPMSGKSNNNAKVSPTPPKKPPRRNLSVSPTHNNEKNYACSNYEYLFMARSGASGAGDDKNLRRGRSTDQYIEMRAPRSNSGLQLPLSSSVSVDADDHLRHKRSDSACEERITHDFEPNHTERRHTTIGQYEQKPHNYPRRKLRRQSDRPYENFEPSCPGNQDVVPTFVSSAYIRLRPSQENMVESAEAAKRKKKTTKTPLSPTNYKQPPTPDHPPPSAFDAERSIYERIRPLSQEYKRRSKDIETETDEDVLYCSFGASSGSLSSNLSSDKSIDFVEEFVGDAPFAGLLKGSVPTSKVEAMSVDFNRPLERPKTLKQIQNIYETPKSEDMDSDDINRKGSQGPTDKSLSILSPFDEQEEWAKISEIMASFGTGLVRESVFVTELEQEFQTRLGLSKQDSLTSPSAPPPHASVGEWLRSIDMAKYERAFVKHGFDDINFINGLIQPPDLIRFGITSSEETSKIIAAIKQLPDKLKKVGSNGEKIPDSVHVWLKSIHLEHYAETFQKHLFSEFQKVMRVWDEELTTVLDIEKIGHRRRILASVGNEAALSADLETTIDASIKPPEETPGGTTSNTGTLRHSKKSRPAPPPPVAAPRVPAANGTAAEPAAKEAKEASEEAKEQQAINDSRELTIRDPNELLVGVPSTLTTHWRHAPYALVNGFVTYSALYLGSTLVKQLLGTESTKKSIHKLKKSMVTRDNKPPEVFLSISYRGVQFLEAESKELVCEHEIRNIHCACQDADDLTHFAYITKDHSTKDHYCHVFCVKTMDLASQIILTLGQAFEVAYQMALREQFTGGNGGAKPGHTRSQSEHQIKSHKLGPEGNGHSVNSHTRSHSINGVIRPDEVTSGTTSRPPIVFTEDM
ncbi:ankyrin repeat and SAM domain-containing protein 1A-like [Neocloeon triangulifer]|uniref:ankyrin repeat and SAM domain-containing protein 1A-like n=1 Tax=Neocloeon triangulifer TaxID=2078957 RepID=UPI00286EDB1D|nr:ankyrin repeat and SAM domain-containing protein 1A-like [Neocloeon triangulifer]